jgi:elongation factor G
MSPVLVEVGIEPRSQTVREELVAHLESRGASFQHDGESGSLMLQGGSEDDLAAIIGDLSDRFGEAILVSAPMVGYRERIGRPVTIDYILPKATGRVGPRVRLKIEFAVGRDCAELQFEHGVTADAVPKAFLAAVETGLRDAAGNGLVAGFPVINVVAQLMAVSSDADAEARAFQTAALRAFRELREKGDIRIVEPLMRVEVSASSEWTDAVTRDLKLRRGRIQKSEQDGVVEALIPLSSLFGYTNSLRALAGADASWSMVFVGYEDVPRPDTDDPNFPAAAAARR